MPDPRRDAKMRKTLEEIAAIRHEFYVGTPTARDMLHLQRIARQVPVDIAAQLRKSFPKESPIQPNAQRVIGMCHLFDYYAKALGRALTKQYPPESMRGIEMPTDLDKERERRKKHIRHAVDAMHGLIDNCRPLVINGFQLYNMLAPYKRDTRNHLKQFQWHTRAALTRVLHRIFQSAAAMHANTDSDLARVATTYLDNRLMMLHSQTNWHRMLQRTIGFADTATWVHYSSARFTPRFAEGVIQYQLPQIYIKKLDVFEDMVRRVSRDMPEGHPRYNNTIARCWALNIDAMDGEDAYGYAREMYDAINVSDAPVKTPYGTFTKREAALIVRVVGERKLHLSKVLSGMTAGHE